MGVVKDIKELKIDPNLSKSERINSVVAQMGNPYVYVDNGTKVRIRYADTQESLTDRLIAVANTSGAVW